MKHDTLLKVNIYYAFTCLFIIVIVAVYHAYGVYKEFRKTKHDKHMHRTRNSSLYLTFLLIMLGFVESLDFILELLINDKFYRIAAFGGPGNVFCLFP